MPQLGDDVLVLRHVVGHVQHVLAHLVRYVLGPVGVDEGVPGLVPVAVGRADVGHHDGVAVAGERVLEEARQLGVAVVDVPGLALGQGVDAVAQGKQGAVDVGALLQSLAAVLQERRKSFILSVG